MNLREMIFELEVLLETTGPALGILARPETEVLVDFLNRAVWQYLHKHYLYGTSHEENLALIQSNSADLHKLIYVSDDLTLISPTWVSSYQMSAVLPSDYLYYIRSDSEVSRITFRPMERGWISNTELSFIYVDKVVTNAYNKPILLHPVVVVRNTLLDLYIDRYTTIYGLKVVYLKKPVTLLLSDINKECELPAYTHSAVVQLAHDMFVQEKTMLTQQASDERKPNAD